MLTRLIALLLMAGLTCSAQQLHCINHSGTGADAVTIQQASSSAGDKEIKSARVTCIAGCTVNVRLNGAAPTGTALSISKMDPNGAAATGNAYYASDVGIPTAALLTETLPANGTRDLLLGGLWLRGVNASVAHASTDTAFESVVVATNVGTVNLVGHGLSVGDHIAIRGATTDTDLNGSYVVATVVDVDSFTIATASVTDATYDGTSDAGMTLTTAGNNVTVSHNAASGAAEISICFEESPF